MTRITELENAVYGNQEEEIEEEIQNQTAEVEQKLQQKENELSQRADAIQKKNQALGQIALKLKEQIELINQFEQQQQQQNQVQLPSEEEIKKIADQIDNLKKLLSATNTYFGGIYNAIKEPLNLQDIQKEDEPVIVMKGLENIVQGISQKLQELK